MHSKNFEKVKGYYQTYLDSEGKRGWSKAMVHNAVGKWITAEEYEEITGDPYQ
jgi:hypothetical protein